MNKRQLILQIQKTHSRIDTRFLSQFSKQDLQVYLQKLQQSSMSRIRVKPHIRPFRREFQAVA
ncbi:MAG: hypothetical protein KatS3mg104_1451 [Phycisphaerae bacterium]|nr:MAG: hypothetical protein KatS3mg104_1451 [Phycisphaerae bacterium]